MSKRTSKNRSAGHLQARITLMFLILAACLMALFGTYWLLVLEPRLSDEALSNARALAQSQARTLAEAITPVDGHLRPQRLSDAMEEILVLTDPNTHRPFILGVEVEVDYDMVTVHENKLDLVGGRTDCDNCFVSEIPLYSTTSRELLGIAKIYSSGAFLQRLKEDVRSKLLIGSGVALLILTLVWWVVSGLLRRVRESERNLLNVFEAAPFPMVLTRLSDNQVLRANQAAHDFFQVPVEQLSSAQSPDFYAKPEERQAVLAKLQEQGRIDSYELELKVGGGETRWVLISALPIEYHGDNAVIVGCADITERKAMEEELKRHATRDALTGILNRRHFVELADAELQRISRYGGNMSALMIDIDHFKQINDTYGHHAGDMALKVMSRACADVLREVDLFGRWGGEEFAVLLPETDLDSAVQLAERLRQSLTQVVVPTDRGELCFTVSIGVVALEPGDEGIDALFLRADRALYLAKDGGRNRVAVL